MFFFKTVRYQSKNFLIFFTNSNNSCHNFSNSWVLPIYYFKESLPDVSVVRSNYGSHIFWLSAAYIWIEQVLLHQLGVLVLKVIWLILLHVLVLWIFLRFCSKSDQSLQFSRVRSWRKKLELSFGIRALEII